MPDSEVTVLIHFFLFIVHGTQQAVLMKGWMKMNWTWMTQRWKSSDLLCNRKQKEPKEKSAR